jgi:hypothetical protein
VFTRTLSEPPEPSALYGFGVTGTFFEEDAQPTKKRTHATVLTDSFNEGRQFNDIFDSGEIMKNIEA